MLQFPAHIQIVDETTSHIALPRDQIDELARYFTDNDIPATQQSDQIAVKAPYKSVLRALMLFPDGDSVF
jgi:hypothetical protein